MLCLLEDPLWVSVEGHLGAPGVRSGNKSCFFNVLKQPGLFSYGFIRALTFFRNKCTKCSNLLWLSILSVQHPYLQCYTHCIILDSQWQVLRTMLYQCFYLLCTYVNIKLKLSF